MFKLLVFLCCVYSTCSYHKNPFAKYDNFGNYQFEGEVTMSPISWRDHLFCRICIYGRGFFAYSVFTVPNRPLNALVFSQQRNYCITDWTNRSDFYILFGHYLRDQCVDEEWKVQVFKQRPELFHPGNKLYIFY